MHQTKSLLFICLVLATCILLTSCKSSINSKDQTSKVELLKEMFSQMVMKKNASLIPKYYHKDFLLYTNGQVMDYHTFLESHIKYYKSPIQYEMKYDEEAFVEDTNGVAARVWITTSRPGEPAKEIEVILIAEYKQDKLFKLWELTWPDWSNLPAFKEAPAS